jgi:hypothetical protein
MKRWDTNQLPGKFSLHPLTHTLLQFNLTQDLEKNNVEPKLRIIDLNLSLALLC